MLYIFSAHNLLRQMLRNSMSNGVEVNGPAIIAVCRGKLPVTQIQPIFAVYIQYF